VVRNTASGALTAGTDGDDHHLFGDAKAISCGMVGLDGDITERKEAEAECLEAETAIALGGSRSRDYYSRIGPEQRHDVHSRA